MLVGTGGPCDDAASTLRMEATQNAVDASTAARGDEGASDDTAEHGLCGEDEVQGTTRVGRTFPFPQRGDADVRGDLAGSGERGKSVDECESGAFVSVETGFA